MTLFIFPHKLERDLVLKSLKDLKLPIKGSEALEFPEGIYAFSGQGKVQMALSVQALCQKFPKIENVLCLGSAGALSENLAPASVVLGKFTVEHDFKIRAREMDVPRFPASEALLNKFDGLNKVIPAAVVGIIASGDEDIVHRARGSELQKQMGALCAAWEGAGAARAAKHLGKKFLEIRAISDLGNESTPQDFEAGLNPAMIALAAVIKYYIES